MAIRFTCPTAPRRKVPCRWCGPEGEWTLQHPDWLTEDGRCDQWCDGTDEADDLPWVEVGNAWFVPFLSLLGLPAEEYGEIPTTSIPAVLRRIMSVLARDWSCDHMVQAPSEGRAFGTPRIVEDPDTGLLTISRGPQVISMGLSDDRIHNRLETLRELLVMASKNGWPVQWS